MMQKFLFLALTAVAAQAATLYDNTTTDQQFSVFYSNGYTQIGDQIQLSSSGLLGSAETQFYNLGADATFDATLTFYEAGSPLGNPIGSPFTVTGISITSLTSQTVAFQLGGLSAPADLVVMLSVQNVSAGGEVGLNFFSPPTVGSSDATFFLIDGESGVTQTSTFLDIDDLHLRIEDVPPTGVPEPSTMGLTGGMLLVLAYSQRRRVSKLWQM